MIEQVVKTRIKRRRKTKSSSAAKRASKATTAIKNGSAIAPKGKALRQDRELVQRCLNGDVTAWEEIFKRSQPQLLVSIKSLLKPSGANTSLAEEIASRVWCSLVNANGNLLDRFDAHRGCRLNTFFAALARHELLQYWRSERRRRKREQNALDRRVKFRNADIDHVHMAWNDFVDTLTQRERQYLEEVLLAPPTASQHDRLSPSNHWQLRSRVLAKLKHYSARQTS